MQDFRRQREQSVGLRHVAQNLRRHLGRRDADRCDQAGLFEHAVLEIARGVDWRTEQTLGAGQIDKCFVERERLDHRTEALEHAPHDARYFDVAIHATRHKDRMRAEFARLRCGHGRAQASPFHF